MQHYQTVQFSSWWLSFTLCLTAGDGNHTIKEIILLLLFIDFIFLSYLQVLLINWNRMLPKQEFLFMEGWLFMHKVLNSVLLQGLFLHICDWLWNVGFVNCIANVGIQCMLVGYLLNHCHIDIVRMEVIMNIPSVSIKWIHSTLKTYLNQSW